MQNQILHPAQHTRRTAQVSQRIGTRYTAGTPSLTRFLGITEVLSFSYAAENGTIRCRIKFCMQHSTLEEQHKWLGESGHDILLEHSRARVLGTIEVLSFSYTAENGTIRCRIKFCIQHSTLEEQHKSSGESGQELSNRVLTSPT
jgi:hypothetical protein